MRWLGWLLSSIAFLHLSGCTDSLRSEPPPAKWTTGFWFWEGSSADVSPDAGTLDVLFVQAGKIDKQTPYGSSAPWSVWGRLPDDLPAAREYWLVFRFERQQVPGLSAAPILASEFSRLREEARQRHLKVTGIQLDIDSPTGALPEYVRFLREVRKGLPTDAEVSITALLDWFREGTAIADVIKETEEFVPQFYDADPNGFSQGGAIAAKFDSARWAPIFNRFHRRFRIGISTFGRAQLVPRASPPRSVYRRVRIFDDLTPLDVATNSSFTLESRRSETNELALSYRAMRQVGIGYNDFQAGDTVQFIISTPDSVRAAVEGARRIQGYCAGVVFFRWPASNETLAMQPAEIMMAAGLSSTPGSRAGVHLVDGACAAVKCTDVYLTNATLFSPTPVRYVIRSSTELEYFLPQDNMPVKMTGPSELTLSLPPYCGRARMYLGRAVTAKRAEYTVEDKQ
jgi:hypothetical protein